MSLKSPGSGDHFYFYYFFRPPASEDCAHGTRGLDHLCHYFCLLAPDSFCALGELAFCALAVGSCCVPAVGSFCVLGKYLPLDSSVLSQPGPVLTAMPPADAIIIIARSGCCCTHVGPPRSTAGVSLVLSTVGVSTPAGGVVSTPLVSLSPLLPFPAFFGHRPPPCLAVFRPVRSALVPAAGLFGPP